MDENDRKLWRDAMDDEQKLRDAQREALKDAAEQRALSDEHSRTAIAEMKASQAARANRKADMRFNAWVTIAAAVYTDPESTAAYAADAADSLLEEAIKRFPHLKDEP